MSRLRILSVGQCGYDHGQISRSLGQALDAEVIRADTHAQAIQALRSSGSFDLVLVNRVGDSDGSPGLDLINAFKADEQLAAVPVMLVSNFAEAQDEAVRAGAIQGFGKSDLGTGKELEVIRSALPGIQ